MRRLASVQKMESEIAKLKENHQMQLSHLKEQLDRNVRLIESVRQEKLATQFEVAALRKDMSSFKTEADEKERVATENIKNLGRQLADCEINYNSVLKEKEEILVKIQSALDKHKRCIFELSSLLGTKSYESTDLCAQVRAATENLLREKALILGDLKARKAESDALELQLSELKESLVDKFPGINEISELTLYVNDLINKLKVLYFLCISDF